MNKAVSLIVLFLLAIMGYLPGAVTVLEPPPDSERDAIVRIAPSVAAETLPPDKHKVSEWVLGANRQRDLKPIQAERILRFDVTYFVKEQDTTRWFVGHVNNPKTGVIECDQNFKDLEALVDAAKFPPLPKPPDGFHIRELCRLPNNPTRLAGDGQGKKLYILCVNGDVWRADLSKGGLTQILFGHDYIDPARGERQTVGMVLDPKNRLYIVANQRNEALTPITNEVTIFRTTATTDAGDPTKPTPWLKTSYPWGIGPFNHGVGHIAFGPDGFLYVTSGSRTDGNERSKDKRYSSEGETPLTACIWRLDPRVEDQPTIELYARGLRNAYAFTWTPRGDMFAADNGPDADPPEELNLIKPGRHYGFPYQFSDWTEKPYKYTPDAPAGMEFVKPLRNRGPDAGGSADKPLSTFDAHSCPLGIVWLGDDFPAGYRGGFFVARFGNLLERKQDVGFDLLTVRPAKDDLLDVRSVMKGVARPVDLHLSGRGKVYICEYSRQIENKGYGGMLPGRILELAVAP